ncbi:Hypothetical protein DAL_101 [Psychrobacter phage D'Alembert]|nr:Hypothetical protein DAL_101 [Psychrobacter phage D'Alembert]
MIKNKVDKYIKELKKYKGSEIDALDRFNSLVQRSEDGDVKIVLHQNLLEVHFLPDEDIYLDIYSDNTVACSEDEYGKYMYFDDDVFNKLMEL